MSLQNDAILISAPSAWLYYQITAPRGHETIKVRSSSTIGNVDLYSVRCRLPSLAQCAASGLPNATYYSLSTEGADQDLINIHRSDEVDSIYIIGESPAASSVLFVHSFLPCLLQA